MTTANRKWPVYYDEEWDCAVILKEDGMYEYHRIVSKGVSHWCYCDQVFERGKDAPQSARPVDLVSEADRKIGMPFGWYDGESMEEETRTNCTSLQEYTPSLEPWERDLLAEYRELESGTKLWAALTSKSLLFVVSDGGNAKDMGSFGWTIATDLEALAQGKGVARGYPMQSFRAEGYG